MENAQFNLYLLRLLLRAILHDNAFQCIWIFQSYNILVQFLEQNEHHPAWPSFLQATNFPFWFLKSTVNYSLIYLPLKEWKCSCSWHKKWAPLITWSCQEQSNSLVTLSLSSCMYPSTVASFFKWKIWEYLFSAWDFLFWLHRIYYLGSLSTNSG